MDQHPNQKSYPPYPPPPYTQAVASTSWTAPPAPSQVQQEQQQSNSVPVQVVVNQNQYYTNYLDQSGSGNGSSFLNRNWTPEWSREPRPSAPIQVAPEPKPTSTSAMAGSSSKVSSSAPQPPPYSRYAYGYDHNRNYTFHETLAHELEELVILDSNQTPPDCNSAIDVESDTYAHALDNCTVPFKYDAPEDFVTQAGYKLEWNTVRQQQEIDALMEELTPEEIKYVQTSLHNYFIGAIQLPNDPNPPTDYIRDYWNYFICPFYFHGYREMEFAD